MQFKYQYHIGIEDQSPYDFLSARGNTAGEKVTITSWLNEWEKWKLLDYDNRGSTGLIHFGDIVAFENIQFSVYMSGNQTDDYVYTQPLLQTDQRWRLLNAADPSSGDVVTSSDEILLQNVTNSQYVQVFSAPDRVVFNQERDRATRFRFINLSVF